MKKKKSEKAIEKEVEKDLEEEEETSDEDQDEADEDEEEERPAVSARTSRERARARAVSHDDHDDHDEPADGEDPTWWAPHAVMSALVIIGVLGFFGVFNKVLAGIAAKPVGAAETTTTHKEEPAKAPPPTTPQPARPGMPQPGADQAPKEMFGAQHLLVMYKGSRRAAPNVERSKDEAKTRATEAMKKAKDPKSKFEDLVKEYSDEPGAGARGGDLGKFPKGAMVPEFQTALEKIKVGEISDLVETPFGFHVIKRTQ